MTQDEIMRLAQNADIEVAHMNKPMTDAEVKQAWVLCFANLVAAPLQAKIDALMLEYCPDEMTDEQLAEWGRHQIAVEGKEPWEVWQETSRTVYVSEDDAWSRRVIVQIGQSKCDICKEQTEVMNIDTSDGEYLSLDCCKKCLNKLWEKSSESK